MKAKTKKALFYAVICGLISVVIGFIHGRRDVKPIPELLEEVTVSSYDDIIDFLGKGISCHWDGMDPDEKDLSPVYMYCSPSCGYCLTDLSGDGVQELLIGDCFEDSGDYQVYDIFTRDIATGELIHLFKGGERDWCSFNGSGIVFENGSDSAFDSFTRHYAITGTKMEPIEDKAVECTLLELHFNKFQQ